MDVEVADEAAGGTEGSPPTAAGWVVLIMSFPRELCAGGDVAGAVADIEGPPTWTNENRARYKRDHLRDLRDEE